MNVDGPMGPKHDLERDGQHAGEGSPPGQNEYTMENLIAKVYFPAAWHLKQVKAALGELNDKSKRRTTKTRAALDSRFDRLKDRYAKYADGAFGEALRAVIDGYEAQRPGSLGNTTDSLHAEQQALGALVKALGEAAAAEEAIDGEGRAASESLRAATSKAEDDRKGGTTEDMKSAMYYRNQAMYRAIVKAKDNDFVMAGLGDNHAEALSEVLADAKIPVIRYKEFKDSSNPAATIELAVDLKPLFE